VGRHRNGTTEQEDFPTYTPQKVELKHRRAPRAPLWARLCVALGLLVVLMSAGLYVGRLFLI
jgi:hypothetical protein